MKKIYLCICLCSISCFFGQGNYCAENFDYTAGSLVSTNGWYTHSGTVNPIAVTTPGLTWASYVGSGVGKITLYRGKEVMKKNINSEVAVDELIMLLKESNVWMDAEQTVPVSPVLLFVCVQCAHGNAFQVSGQQCTSFAPVWVERTKVERK